MKEFPVKIFKPLEGTLNAVTFENSSINLPKTLFFKIEVIFRNSSKNEIDFKEDYLFEVFENIEEN